MRNPSANNTSSMMTGKDCTGLGFIPVPMMRRSPWSSSRSGRHKYLSNERARLAMLNLLPLPSPIHSNSLECETHGTPPETRVDLPTPGAPTMLIRRIASLGEVSVIQPNTFPKFTGTFPVLRDVPFILREPTRRIPQVYPWSRQSPIVFPFRPQPVTDGHDVATCHARLRSPNIHW